MTRDYRSAYTAELLHDVMATVGIVEKQLFADVQRRLFRTEARVAMRHGPKPGWLDLGRLADPLVRTIMGPDAHTISVVSDCAVVVMGKLASAELLKARAYRMADGLPVTVKVWRAVEGHPSGGEQERTIRHELLKLPGFPAPVVLGEGRAGTADYIDYILEPIVYGRHPWSARARVDAALDLVPALASAWRRWGTVDEPLGRVFDDGVLKRVRQVIVDPSLRWNEAWLSRRRLLLRLWRLARRNHHLPCAPGHGDIVTTNIIREENGRHVLIDWEHGRQMPVAFDLVKLLLTSGRPADVNRRLAHHVRPFGQGRARYGWNEQLALGLCRVLSWSVDRRSRAASAGRLEQFDRERTAQIDFLMSLLHDE